MSEFSTPVDIGNRALQHVGVGGKNRIVSFADDDKNASAVAFAYDKVRKAELRRNVWRFAIRRATLRPIDTTTLLIVPAAWSATTAYPVGAIVSDSSGILWVNATPINLNKTPGADPSWDVFFGPLTATPYDATIAYDAGELVYEDNGAGKIEVFAALTTGAGEDPSATDSWSATTIYAKGQTVISGGFYYLSLVDQNLNQSPTAYDMWNVNSTYAANATLIGNDGKLYQSLVGSNKGHDPITDSLLYNPNTTNFGGAHWMPTGAVAAWTSAFLQTVSSNQWCGQVAGVASLNIIYPLGSGPSSQSTTRNAYRLPNGYLRQAPQDPKAGAVSFLGGPTGNTYKDWGFEGNYLVTREGQAIVFRFVADITLVSTMDDMFCEGLAARLGYEVCEEITQSTDKQRACTAAYGKFMDEARIVNGIELGPVEAADDEFISVRM